MDGLYSKYKGMYIFSQKLLEYAWKSRKAHLKGGSRFGLTLGSVKGKLL